MEPQTGQGELSAPQQSGANQDTQGSGTINNNSTSAANAHRRISSYQVFVPTADPTKDHFVPGNTLARPSPQAMANPNLTGGPGVITKRSMPSCSNLPNIWTPDMDRYIVRIVMLNDVEPQASFVRAVKNRFPELTDYTFTEDAITNRVEWLDMAGKDNYFQRPTARLQQILQERGIQIPAPVDEAESSDQSPSEEYRMKSDLEVFGSDEPLTGLLAIGCSNDDPDPYAPPARQPTMNVPGSTVMLPPRSNLNRTALTSHNIMNDTVPARRPVQIAGQYDDQAGSPYGRNFNPNIDEPSTSYGRAFHGNDENQASTSYGRSNTISSSRDHTANVNYGVASSSYDRPTNTNIGHPSSSYGRTLSPTTNEPSSAYGSTYGSASPDHTTRRPVNPTAAASQGRSTTSPLPSPRGREFPTHPEALNHPRARAGNPGQTNMPGTSSTSAGGISESLENLKLKDNTRGNQ